MKTKINFCFFITILLFLVILTPALKGQPNTKQEKIEESRESWDKLINDAKLANTDAWRVDTQKRFSQLLGSDELGEELVKIMDQNKSITLGPDELERLKQDDLFDMEVLTEECQDLKKGGFWDCCADPDNKDKVIGYEKQFVAKKDDGHIYFEVNILDENGNVIANKTKCVRACDNDEGEAKLRTYLETGKIPEEEENQQKNSQINGSSPEVSFIDENTQGKQNAIAVTPGKDQPEIISLTPPVIQQREPQDSPGNDEGNNAGDNQKRQQVNPQNNQGNNARDNQPPPPPPPSNEEYGEIFKNVLDTSYEHSLVARNVIRTIQSSVPNELVTNGLYVFDNTYAHNHLWGKVLYEYGHHTASLHHINHTKGILIGNTVNIDSQKSIGIVAGFTSTGMRYKKAHRGAKSKQNSFHGGIYGSFLVGKFFFSDVFVADYIQYKDLINPSIERVNKYKIHSTYHGKAISNKFSMGYILEAEQHVFCPEVSIYYDYIQQNKHGYRMLDHYDVVNDRTHDTFVTCETGIRYFNNSNPIITPNIFVGYEFTLKRDIGTRSMTPKQNMISSEAINSDNFVARLNLNYDLFQQTQASILLDGIYRKHHSTLGIGVVLSHQF